MAIRNFLTNLYGLSLAAEPGGLVNTYLRNTSTRVAVYTDIAGTTPATNPVVADSLGQITFYYSDAVQYTWRATTANGATVLWEASVVGGSVSYTFIHDGLIKQFSVDATGTGASQIVTISNVILTSDHQVVVKADNLVYSVDEYNVSNNGTDSYVTLTAASGADINLRSNAVQGLTGPAGTPADIAALPTLPDATTSCTVAVIDQTGTGYKATSFIGGSSTVKTPAWTIERNYTGQASFRPWTLLLRNRGETAASPNDYQNEVHLVMKAGTSTNHRRYINWVGYDDTTHYILGTNGQKDFVVHDHEAGVHRLSFFHEDNGGHTILNASGASGIIRMGYHPQDEVPPLAVKMYRGGLTADATLAFDFQPEYLALYSDAGDLSMILRADTGNIGLGKTSPNYKVDIETTGNQPFRWVADSDGNPSTFLAGNTGISYTTTVTSTTAQFELIDQDNSDTRAVIHAKGNAGAIDALFVASSGKVGIKTATPTHALDVNDDSIRIRTAKTPSSASDTGTQGQIAWDSNYIYICTATDTWKRAAIATW